MPGIVATNTGGKVCQFGLEYVNTHTWKNWEPGREYVKNVTLKNVRSKVLRLKYKLPASQFFVTLFPQSIVLPPGTSHTLPVTFRPLAKTQYKDSIEILTNEGRFLISLQGILPEIVVDIPNEVNFGMCAVGDQLTTSFDVKNLSEEVTDFEIDCSPLFNIDPVRGRLEPMSSVTITTAFKPTTAVAFTGTAVIRYGKELLSEKTMNLTAIGKYAHLVASGNGSPAVGCNCAVDFGNVPVGKDAERWIDLKNYSPVNAIFHIEPEAPSDGLFSFMQRDGIVPAGSSLRIPIRFHPQIVGKKYNDYFNVHIKGSTAKTVISCTGSCKGPLVTISERVLSFGCTKAGYSVKRTITLSNEANMDATFQFQIDCSQSPFKLSPSQGVISAQGTQTIIVSFEPSHPINYYRQVTCLILHQFPICLELIGTCHSDTQKPAILQHKHVLNYAKIADSDISFHPPEVIGEWIQQGKITLDSEGRFQTQTALMEHENMMDHYFNDGYHSDVTYSLPHVSLDVNEVHFGSSSVKEKVVSITNHTKGKVTVVWLTDDNAIFTVTPQTCDIPPEQAATVIIRFKPAREGQFYGAQLEGYAYYTTLRDNRLVPEGALCPPWCLNVTVTGSTFPANVEHFVPHCEWDSSSIALDAIAPNQVSYQTVMLSNIGSTPILFEVDREKLDNVIGVKPARGYIEVGSHQVFVVKLALTDVNLYHQIVYIKLNDSGKNTQELIVSGTSELPDLLLDNKGQLFFKPTCVGSTSPQFVGVRNISHYPVTFEWKMHSTDQQLLAVEPSSGIIQPNEKQFHKWSFKPDKEDKFIMKPSIIVRQLKSQSGEAALFTLKAVGEGTRGKLQSETLYQDFGTVIVGSLAYRPITIVNDNDCGVHYQLSIEQKEDGPYKPEELKKDRCVLVLDNASGYLPAHSRCFVHASCRPMRRVNYQWDVSYQLVSSDGNLISSESFHLCHLLATGVYPLLSVVDVHSGGSAKALSKRQVWNLLSIDHFNKCLEGDPTLSELTLFQEKELPTRAMAEFNFSAAPVGSEPSVMEIVFQNTGHAACEWAFLFPNDLEMDVEYWAETSDFTDEQLHQLKIMDNKLFFVQPRRGRLEIGETVAITLTHKHEMPGTDKLPLLLKLSQGREILLNLIGVTVELSRHYAHFARHQHTFAPTQIGLKPSPVQMYELYNGGALPVKYFIDVEPLEQLRHENFDHSIFECLNLTGEIKPGSTASIEWIFSPLEAKTYSIDVPIRIEHAETTTITFTGVGYDRRILGDAKPAETGLVIPSKKTSVPADKNKLCVLSDECIALGDVPLFTKIRRYVTVTNQSTTHGATFKWYLTTSQDSKYVTVTPPLGTIPPGQSVQCKVTFVSCGAPTLYNIYIVCEVTNLTDYAKYEAALSAWEQEQVRQRTEFTITEKTLKQEALNGSADKFSGSRSLQSSDLNARYKKALPPIGNGTSEQESPGRRLRNNRLVWNKPQPPNVTLLHVAVVAQTHSLPEYQQHNLNEYKSYFIDRSIQSNITTPSVREPGQVRCLTAEADVVGETLASIIRSLLDDPTFHEAAHKATTEQVPYYQQLTRPVQTVEIAEQIKHYASEPLTGVLETRATLSSPDIATNEQQEQQSSSGAVSATISTHRQPAVSSPVVGTDADRLADATSRASLGQRSAAASKALPSRAGSVKNKIKTQEEMSSENFAQNQQLKQNAVFGSLIESVVENALTNVLEEAFRGEFNIASRPRLVALLPKSKSGSTSLN